MIVYVEVDDGGELDGAHPGSPPVRAAGAQIYNSSVVIAPLKVSQEIRRCKT